MFIFGKVSLLRSLDNKSDPLSSLTSLLRPPTAHNHTVSMTDSLLRPHFSLPGVVVLHEVHGVS